MPAGHGDHAGHGEHANHADHEAHGHASGHQHHDDHRSHQDHGHAGHTAHAHGPATWKMAALATLHCLTGCAIGEVLGLAVGTALGWGNMQTIVLAIVLAFVFGYGLTLFGIRGAGLSFGAMVKVALAADTVSIIVMEIIDNGSMMVIPGAMDAGLGDALFWGALAGAFALAFVVTTPVNKALISAGKGHAVVHGMH
ncbi:MAG: DUF4396 domain-containing protein [Streptomycetaceae bacterium]|nr:DUF4396 domain-containing protein [Streptomycetaceae bacterium]